MSKADEKVLEIVTSDISECRQHMQEMSSERYRAYDLYRFQPLGNEKDGFSTAVDSVAFNTVEWLKPTLTAVFGDEFFHLKSGNPEAADRMANYLKYLYFRKQKGKRLNKDVVHNCLINHYGIFKIAHREDYDLETAHYDTLDEDQFMELVNTPGVSITKYTTAESFDDFSGPVVIFENVKAVTKKTRFAGPKVSVVPAWELYYLPGYPDLESCPFVAHRFKLTLDDVRKRERAGKYKKGSWEKVKDFIDNTRGDNEDNVGEISQQFWVEGLSSPSGHTGIGWEEQEQRLGQNEIWVWECYFNMDIDDDGLLEPVICTVAADHVLESPVENPYKKAPFVLGYAHKEPHKMEGLPYPLMLESEQKEQTNLKRLTVDAAAESTYRTMVTRDATAQRQWVNRVIGGAILGNPEAFKEVATNAPSQFILRAIELNQKGIESKSGVSRFDQGLDPSSWQNKTATGVSLAMSASQMRRKAITESIGEAFEELVRRMIEILQLFPPQDMERLAEGGLDLNPDDFGLAYEIEIDIGVGPQEKQAAAMHLNEHIGFLVQVGIPAGIADLTHLVRAIYRKYRLLDIPMKDMLHPEEVVMQKVQQQQQDQGFLQQAVQLIQGAMQKGVPPEQVGAMLIQKIMEVTGGGQGAGNPGGGGAQGGSPQGRAVGPSAPGGPAGAIGPGGP